MRKKKTSPWIFLAATGAVVGVVALAVRAAAKSDTQQSGAPLPTGMLMTSLVVDPGAVRAAQAVLADGIASNGGAGGKSLGLSPSDYTQGDIDGNPSNPRFARALSIFQTAINNVMLNDRANGTVKVPQGFPDQLRTDGILDYATATALNYA